MARRAERPREGSSVDDSIARAADESVAAAFAGTRLSAARVDSPMETFCDKAEAFRAMRLSSEVGFLDQRDGVAQREPRIV